MDSSQNDTEDIDIMSYINKDKLNLINDAFNKLGMGLVSNNFLSLRPRPSISFFKSCSTMPTSNRKRKAFTTSSV